MKDQTPENDHTTPFAQKVAVGFVSLLIIPIAISAFLHHYTHLGIPVTGLLLCYLSMVLFVGMFKIYLVFFVIKWVLGIIPRFIKFLLRQGSSQALADSIHEPLDDAKKPFLFRYIFVFHLICSATVFYATSRWLLSGNTNQIGAFLASALVFTLGVTWAERVGVLDEL